MRLSRLLADAGARALANLVRETGTDPTFETQHGPAQSRAARDLPQRLARGLPRGERSVQVGRRCRIDRARSHIDRWRGFLRNKQRDHAVAATQALIVRWQEALDEPRFA